VVDFSLRFLGDLRISLKFRFRASYPQWFDQSTDWILTETERRMVKRDRSVSA